MEGLKGGESHGQTALLQISDCREENNIFGGAKGLSGNFTEEEMQMPGEHVRILILISDQGHVN